MSEHLPAELLPTLAGLQRLRLVANGTEAGDLIIRNARVVAVHTGEVLTRDVVVAGAHIAAVTPVGRFDAPAVVDADGLHLVPNFIDAHIHIEYTMLTPGELARLIVPRGTTTLLADPNCIANVLGPEAIDLVGTTGTPLRILQQISPEVPRLPGMELGGATVPDDEVLRRIALPNVVSLGEGNPFNLSEASARKQLAALAAGKRITGHTARLADEPLWAYLAGGVGDDHNAFTTAEVLDRLRLGSAITVMAGSMNDNTPAVFADVGALGDGLAHISFCADDKHVEDLAEQGHIDHHVRQAVRAGVPPATAIRMATLNAAVHFRLDHVLGSVTPSRLADVMLVADLADPRPAAVFVGGVQVAADGRPLFANTDVMPDSTRSTVHLAPGLSGDSFAVRADGPTAWVQAAEMYDGYFKRAFHAELPVVGGTVCCDTRRDVVKVAVVDRHHATATIGVGYVRGFGLRRGALAATTNCENQNLVVLGTDDAAMAAACHAAAAIGGGYVAVDGDGMVLAACPLPIAGIMSDAPWEDVRDASVAVNAAAVSLGVTIPAPFMIMAFVGLAGVPELGLTELGLIDVATQSFTPVVLQPGLVCCRCPSHAHDVHRLFDPTGVLP
ncbi:MAG: adenine deaminase C-terminal domain-containing protein [Ilumatobacteraceae bacterium]